MTEPINTPLEEALRRTCSLDALGSTQSAFDRAVALARLLPQPSEGGLRAWFDRAIATIALPTFDEPAHALQGVRRLSGARARGWKGVHTQVEVELEPVAALADAPRFVLRGQVTDCDGHPVGSCAVAAVARDGTLLATAHADREGYFDIEVSAGTQHLSIAASREVLLLDDVLGPPQGGPATGGLEG